MQPLKRRGEAWLLVLLSGAVALGGAGLLLGPTWAVAGVVAGPFMALLVASVVVVFTRRDPADLLETGRHREALSMIGDQMPAWRLMARIWPGQFREALAQVLMDKSMALLAAHRDGEALAVAEQGVAIYRSLAAARPGKPAPGLAGALNNLSYPLRVMGRRDEALAVAEEAVRMYRALAADRPGKYRYDLARSLGTEAEVLSLADEYGKALAATIEAARIYQGIRAGDRAAQDAAEVLFLHGQLLCGLSRHHEAAQPLAQAWRLAARQGQQEPRFDRAVLETAYRADPSRFLDTWRAETGADPPHWLTSDSTRPH